MENASVSLSCCHPAASGLSFLSSEVWATQWLPFWGKVFCTHNWRKNQRSGLLRTTSQPVTRKGEPEPLSWGWERDCETQISWSLENAYCLCTIFYKARCRWSC
jgi:hypothetical protein